jgi:hypothetical protein
MQQKKGGRSTEWVGFSIGFTVFNRRCLTVAVMTIVAALSFAHMECCSLVVCVPDESVLGDVRHKTNKQSIVPSLNDDADTSTCISFIGAADIPLVSNTAYIVALSLVGVAAVGTWTSGLGVMTVSSPARGFVRL